jgi:hypothetical protein
MILCGNVQSAFYNLYVANLIDDIEGVSIYVILGQVVIVLRVLHEPNFLTLVVIEEEA